jgi:hypothetical protein
MSLVQGGTLPNVPQFSLGGGNLIGPTAVMVDMTVQGATTPITVLMLTDYAMVTDGGALSRPASYFSGLSFPLTLKASSREQLSFGEASALVKLGAAVFN